MCDQRPRIFGEKVLPESAVVKKFPPNLLGPVSAVTHEQEEFLEARAVHVSDFIQVTLEVQWGDSSRMLLDDRMGGRGTCMALISGVKLQAHSA